MFNRRSYTALGLTLALWAIAGIYFGLWNQTATAGPPPIECDQGIYLTVDSTPEVMCRDIWPDDPGAQELLWTQEEIHSQLFDEPFKWCTGSFWELDEDIAELDDPFSPIMTTGQTFGGEEFIVEVHDITTVNLDDIDLSPEERQFAEDWSYNCRVYGTIVNTPNGEIEVWGLSHSLIEPDTEVTTTVFMPLNEGDILPFGDGSFGGFDDPNKSCDDLTGLEACICFEWLDYVDCIADAKETWLLMVSIDLGVLVVDLLACLVKAAVAGPLSTFALAVCLLVIVAAMIVWAGLWDWYQGELDNCYRDYRRGVKRCHSLFPDSTNPAF